MRLRHLLFCTLAAVALGPASLRADLAKAPTALTAAVKELDEKLSKNPYGAGWRKYLDWNALVAQLNSTEPDRAALIKLLKLFTRPGTDLDLPEFAKVRHGLEAWLDEIGYPKWEQLPDVVKSAGSAFSFPWPSDVEQRHQRLQDTMTALDRYLIKYGDWGKGWKKYLLWDLLSKEVHAAGHGDPMVLEKVYRRFLAGADSWNQPTYTALEAALADYLPTAWLKSEPQAEEQFATHLDTLAKLLESPAPTTDSAPADADRRDRIAQVLRWLQQRKQVPDLVDAVRHYQSQPNFVARLSKELIQAEVEADFNETERVNESILGSAVRGTARTVGRLSISLQPDPRRAIFDLQMEGRAFSSTIGYADGAVIRSNSTTDVRAKKRIELTGNGIVLLPTEAHASTSTTPTSVSAGGGQRDSIARNRVAQSRSQAENISSQRVESTVRQRFDANVGKLLSSVTGERLASGQKPTAWKAPYFPDLSFSTTRGELIVQGLQASISQLAAPTSAPAPLPADLLIQIHESFFNNRARDMLAGRTLTQDNFMSELNRVLFNLLDPSTASALSTDETAWSMTLVEDRPLRLRLHDGQCEIKLCGNRFVARDEEAPPMDITANFQVAVESGVAHLRLQDKLGIYPPGFVPNSGNRLGGRYLAVRRTLEKRLSGLFPATLTIDGIPLPAGTKQPGPLPITAAKIEDGWLIIACQRTGPVPAVPESK